MAKRMVMRGKGIDGCVGVGIPRPLYLLFILFTVVAGCTSSPGRSIENTYANKSEAAVRSELGEPRYEFAGHYGAPPMDFMKQFPGEIRTLVFKKPGGEFYVSFEKHPSGWVSIRSSWLPEGGEF